jgi:hypothetical protein
VLVVVFLLLPGVLHAQSARQPRLSFGLVAGRVDFAKQIRFDDGNAIGLRGLAQLQPWWELGMQFDRVSARDRKLDRWQNLLVASIQSRFVARTDSRWRPLLGVGVSFMGFEDSELFDAVAEGLDLTLGLHWQAEPRWALRAELLSRMQSFNMIVVDDLGRPTGQGEETGYRWSRVFQIGLEHEF